MGDGIACWVARVNPISSSEVSSLTEATTESVSFLGNKKYIDQVYPSKAAVILLPEGFDCPEDNKVYIACKNPSASFSKVIDYFAADPIEFPRTIHPLAYVASTAQIGENVHIGPHVTIEEGAVIGDNSVVASGSYVGHCAVLQDDVLIYPNVTIRERSEIGFRCIVHSGSSIGSDGFGFIPGANGHTKIPQVGIVVLEDDVEIGANSCVDRARFGKTIVGQGTKVDNLVQVAHNVKVGKHCFLVAQSGIAGSTTLGNGVIIAGQSAVAGHLIIGDGVTVSAKSGVTKDYRSKEVLFGTPAIPRKDFVAEKLAIKKVARLEKQLKELQKKLES